MERKKLGKLGSIGAGGLAILSVAGCGGGEVDSEKIKSLHLPIKVYHYLEGSCLK